MIRICLMAILVAAALPAAAQIYAGRGTLHIASSGSSSATALVSEQLSCRFTPGTGRVLLLFKAESLLRADGTADAPVMQGIFEAASSTLWTIEADLTPWALQDGSTQEVDIPQLPVTILANDRSVRQPAAASLKLTPAAFTLDLSVTLHLADLGLNVPAPLAGRFADEVTLTIPAAELTRR
ncbi:MAG: hypothetical protein NW241_22680 [Bacteroidia bacterium]|nr:hypothetical protein [Bacteroidia bacterium]